MRQDFFLLGLIARGSQKVQRAALISQQLAIMLGHVAYSHICPLTQNLPYFLKQSRFACTISTNQSDFFLAADLQSQVLRQLSFVCFQFHSF